jgi:di/tricarboxylate transporter
MPTLAENAHAYGVIAFTLLAFFLFTRERIPIPVTSLFVIAGLALGFHLFPYTGARGAIGAGQIFSAFGHEALVAICSLMILGRALMVTGALEPVARVLARLWAFSHVLATLALLAVAMGLSTVINDTPVVVILMPVVIGLALRAGGSVSKMLMPMNFAVIVGGMATTIGTSTNLLIVSIANDRGVPPIGLFQFTPLVVGPALLALAYLWLIAPRLLRERPGALAELAPRRFDAVLYIGPRSAARGRTVNSVRRMTGNRMRVQRVLRGDRTLAAVEELEITEGDRLFVSDTSAYLKDYERSLGATLYDARRVGELPP